MCGFSVILKPDGVFNAVDNVEIFKQKVELLVHRGPDSSNWFSNNFCFMGHNRLSIFDQSPLGEQPFSSKCGRYKLVFNGSIYNYKELSNQHDISLTTQCDTELLVELLAKIGVRAIDQINGMFSFVFYDSLANTIIAARDRFGIKPLFWSRSRDMISFASELKGLLGDNLEFDTSSALDHIYFGYRFRDASDFFCNVEALAPGQYILVDQNGGIQLFKYYDATRLLHDSQHAVHPVDEDIFSDEFERAVEYRLRGDVNPAVYLSCGLDSTSIAIAAKNLGVSLHCLTMGSIDVSPKDKALAERTAERLGHKFSFICCEDLPLPSFDKMIWHNESPVKASHMLDWSLAFAARQNGNKVVLDGNGGDEFFAGYYPFQILHMSTTRGFFNLKNNKIHKNLLFRAPQSSTTNYYLDIFKTLLSGKTKLGQSYGPDDVVGSYSELAKKYLHKKMYPLLQHRDRNAMAHSVELRVPFLDHQFIERTRTRFENFFERGDSKAPIRRYVSRNGWKDLAGRKKNTFMKPQISRKKVSTFSRYFLDIGSDCELKKLAEERYCQSLGDSQLIRAGQLAILKKVMSV